MHSSFRVGRRVAATLVVVSSLAPILVTSAFADFRALDGCQKAIARASWAFVGRELGELGRCAVTVLRCVEQPPDDGECLARAGTRCRRVLERLEKREERLASTIGARCADFDAAALRTAAGLGFDALADGCPRLRDSGAGADAIGICVAGHQRCRAERLLVLAVPRAAELLRAADVVPEHHPPLSCLPDLGGEGEGGGDANVAPALLRCVDRTQRATARFASRVLAGLTSCLHATFPCGTIRAGDATCLARADVACERAFRRISGARLGFGRALTAACANAQVPFDALAAPTGANLEALAELCAEVGVDDVSEPSAWTSCIGRRGECDLASAVAVAVPRADELLTLVGRSRTSSFCPVSEPSVTPLPDELPTATDEPTPVDPTPTATVTGPTRTPRPGETATPTASPTPTQSASATPSRSPTPTRSRTPTPRPTATPVCGNGVVEGDEECDGFDLDDNDCELLCDEPDPPGTLACRPDCRFDFRGCRGTDCEP